MVGLHSPWGTIWSIAQATGWSVNYILWGLSWANIQMMLADAPRYTTDSEVKELTDIEDAKEFLNIK